jgi:hypothetical protein
VPLLLATTRTPDTELVPSPGGIRPAPVGPLARHTIKIDKGFADGVEQACGDAARIATARDASA